MKWLLFICVFSLPALAYNEAIHGYVTGKALSGPELDEVLQPPTQADLNAFRELFVRVTSKPLRDSYEFKQFLMLNPDARVHGFDLTPDDAKPMTRAALLDLAARWPDDDQRNRHRYFRDDNRQIVRGSNNQPIPYDPATLDFGGLTGTTSQGHAHYGLVSEPLSSDTEVLKKEPWRFAVPATAHAYGPEFVRIYTELAELAGTSTLPSAPWLQAVFAGAAFHHLEDMCNQIHTVQVGIYDFFRAAFVQSKLRDLKTMGGLFGRRYSLKQIGLRLIANHHLLSEDLFAKNLLVKHEVPTPGAPPLTLDDPQIHGDDLSTSIINLSSREAATAYKLSWTYSAPSLRDGVKGHEFGDGDDPDKWVSDTPEAKAAIQQANELGWKGLRRAATAVRLQWKIIRAAQDPSLTREAAFLTDYHAQAAFRRSQYKPAGPDDLGIAWGYPFSALLLIAVIIYFINRHRTRDR
ncbi:MAG TPA: hypothetical protein VH083_01910 [Myxococcales bacterium]|jgi:hypothetical protein|nr:hypothetical protein [Myxococcales bacterium]